MAFKFKKKPDPKRLAMKRWKQRRSRANKKMAASWEKDNAGSKKRVVVPGWFREFTPKQRDAYLKAHPNSKLHTSKMAKTIVANGKKYFTAHGKAKKK